MAGIYVHIPFCASRCIYCDFYSTTRLDLRRRYADAICSELRQRQGELRQKVQTVYMGGGTPSQLQPDQLWQLFDAIDATEAVEVTMECNPDDITPQFARLLSQLPVNRVSMGVQTFSDHRLRFLHRRHTSDQARRAVDLLREAGLSNISLDLMYGFPGESLTDWHNDIDQLLQLAPEHVSAYSLMYEEGTPLHGMLAKGLVSEADEELSLQMYTDLTDRLADAGYEHYEISNFARSRQLRSLHNSNYWNHTPYLGIGAAAHSFDGRMRRWNVSDLQAYIDGMEQGTPIFDTEAIDADTFYNEQVMTALRTCEGLTLSTLAPAYRPFCMEQAATFIDDGLLTFDGHRLVLSRKGLFVSNIVMSGLMKV